MSGAVYKLSHILTKREKMHAGIILVAILGMAFAQALGVASIMPFISLVMEPDMVFENRYLNWVYDTFNFTSVNHFTIFTGVVMVVILVSANAVNALATYLKLRFAWMNNHRLSRRLLGKYLSMPFAYFLNQNSSDLSKNVLQEINHLTKSYMIPLMMIITKGAVALFILLTLFLVDFAVSLVALVVFGGAYAVIFLRINRSLVYRGAERMKANKMRYKAVTEAFGGIKEIKVLSREPYFLERYSKASLKQARHQAWNAVIGKVPHFALEAVAFGGIVVFVLILLVTREDARQVIPLASLFAFAGLRLMPALKELFHNFTKMQFNRAVLDRIYEDVTSGEVAGEVQPVKQENLPEPLPLRQEIRLENVSYFYPNAKEEVIKDINLAIEKNTMVAFVGPTGAGKTTLVDIILGLLPPQKGRLLVDDVTIDESNLRNWQRNIGYVPQYIYLSDDKVARNIALGVPDNEIDMAMVEKAARTANIHDFIAHDLPDGYDTFVGERGIRLSGGQRQRIGIARALYHDPQVLVFDEATSALDGSTEEMILGAMENAAKSKTLIVIAHRLTTVKTCDVVYMLDKGEVVASGTYDELLGTNEQFKAMARSR